MSYSCDETYDVYNETRTKARKAHTCSACKDTIAPGHLYTRVAVVFDGTVTSYKRCVRCQTLHKHLRELCSYDMWPDERLACGMAYEEEWGELPEEIEELAFLTPEEAQKRLLTPEKNR